MTKSAAVLLLGAVIGSTTPGAPPRRYIEGRLPDADRPFSDAVMAGDTLYLSGKIGRGPDGKVPADAKAEAKLVLDDVQKTLVAAGLSMDDLVSVQIFCSDVAHYAAFNEVYRGYFKKELPARAFIGSGKLLFDARFEVQAIAVRR
jgi:reactive intermediate/imine deaminase